MCGSIHPILHLTTQQLSYLGVYLTPYGSIPCEDELVVVYLRLSAIAYISLVVRQPLSLPSLCDDHWPLLSGLVC